VNRRRQSVLDRQASAAPQSCRSSVDLGSRLHTVCSRSTSGRRTTASAESGHRPSSGANCWFTSEPAVTRDQAADTNSPRRSGQSGAASSDPERGLPARERTSEMPASTLRPPSQRTDRVDCPVSLTPTMGGNGTSKVFAIRQLPQTSSVVRNGVGARRSGN
jgi:hypothetical protein